jgi:hypothetical protein
MRNAGRRPGRPPRTTPTEFCEVGNRPHRHQLEVAPERRRSGRGGRSPPGLEMTKLPTPSERCFRKQHHYAKFRASPTTPPTPGDSAHLSCVERSPPSGDVQPRHRAPVRSSWLHLKSRSRGPGRTSIRARMFHHLTMISPQQSGYCVKPRRNCDPDQVNLLDVQVL